MPHRPTDTGSPSERSADGAAADDRSPSPTTRPSRTRLVVTVAAIGSLAVFGAVLLSGTALRATPALPSQRVVVIGASISQGYRATPGHAWVSLAKDALRDDRIDLVDASIGATRLLTETDVLPSSLGREQHDGLAVPGVTTLVLTDVINDIQAEPHEDDPNAILAGMREFVEVAHAQGVSVIVTTLTPYGGYERWSAEGEWTRRAVNSELRRGTVGDGLIDFDAALRDPADPSAIRPDLDSGDHLHPNDAGQEALAHVAQHALGTPPGSAHRAE